MEQKETVAASPLLDHETDGRQEDLLLENFEIRAELVAAGVVIDDLRRRMANLEEENRLLKEGISRLMFDAKFQRMPSSETRRRWEYYHAHKNEILAELSTEYGLDDRPSWHIVKRLTDEAYERQAALTSESDLEDGDMEESGKVEAVRQLPRA